MTSTKTMRLVGLAAAASIVLAACGGGGATPAPSVAPTEAPSNGASMAPGELPTPEVTKISFGMSNAEMTQWAAILAIELGILKDKYGIEATYSFFEGDAKVVQAVQAGQIDIGVNGVSSIISSQLTDVPLVVVSVNGIVLTDDIVCQAGLDTADEIKGKTIAISTFGGTAHGAALLGAQALGLSATDVVFTLVGNQTARIAALQGGSVDCAVVDTNKQAEMLDLGFSIAVQLKEERIPWGRAGMQGQKEFVEKNPNTILAIVAAALEAQQVIWEDPNRVIPIHQKVTQSSLEEATLQVTDFQSVGNRSTNWPDEAFTNPRKIMATANPDVVDIDITTAYDRSFLEKLNEMGFHELVGAPFTWE